MEAIDRVSFLSRGLLNSHRIAESREERTADGLRPLPEIRKPAPGPEKSPGSGFSRMKEVPSMSNPEKLRGGILVSFRGAILVLVGSRFHTCHIGLWGERKNVAEVLTSGIANHDKLPIPPTKSRESDHIIDRKDTGITALGVSRRGTVFLIEHISSRQTGKSDPLEGPVFVRRDLFTAFWRLNLEHRVAGSSPVLGSKCFAYKGLRHHGRYPRPGFALDETLYLDGRSHPSSSP